MRYGCGMSADTETNALRCARIESLDFDRFSGVRVIADVHGSFDAFEAALCEAEHERLFVIQLGDVIDRGPYSPLCAQAVMEMCSAGQGAMVMGNHEWRFLRFVRDGANRAGSRQMTLSQFREFGDDAAERFVEFVATLPLWIRLPNAIFVHAAFHPKMMEEGAKATEEVIERALFGENVDTPVGLSRRQYGWVDRVPAGMTVVIGHDVTADGVIENLTGRAGGKVVRLDTGAWKDQGRSLTCLDFSFERLGLRPS